VTPRQAFIWVLVLCVVLLAAAGVAALVFDLPQAGQIIASAVLVAVYSFAGLACAAMLSKRHRVGFVRLTLACAAISLAGWLAFIWLESILPYSDDRNLARVAATPTVIGAFTLYVAMITLPRLHSVIGRWFRRGAIGAAGCTGLLLLALIWAEDHLPFQLFGRTLGVLALLASLGTVVVPLFWRLERVRLLDLESTVEKRVPVTLTCPRCGERLETRANTNTACRGCGLRLRVQFEEPRCVCGYLLYGLTGDRCPECGRPIPHDRRWGPDEPPSVSTSNEQVVDQ